jgi:hypothetical protein
VHFPQQTSEKAKPFDTSFWLRKSFRKECDAGTQDNPTTGLIKTVTVDQKKYRMHAISRCG